MLGNDDHSRRRVLQALTGAGALGFTGGAATGAYLDDRSVFPGNRSQAGSLTMELAATTAEGDDSVEYFPDEDDFENTATVSVGFPDIEPGDEGILACAHRVCETLGHVWLRILADGAPDTELDEYVHVQLAERENCDEVTGELFDGSLADLDDDYLEGTQLGGEDDCSGCEPTCLDLEWSFDDDPPAELTNDSLSLTLEFAAVQCRHQHSAENPWD